MEYIIILTNFGTKENAQKTAKALVENNLCACVNILNNVDSFYRWKGEIVEDREFTALIKTRASLFEKVKDTILKNHEYELPEIIAIKIENAHRAYLNWISENTNE